MLECRAVTLAAGERTLCRALDVRFAPGQLWAILGRNGTGKSTLMHTLAGLTRPQDGAIEVDGVPLSRLHARTRARKIGLLLQVEEGVYWGTVAEYVMLGRFPHRARWSGAGDDDAGIAQAALDAVGLTGFGARRYATLSGGERQRARIAQVIAQSPQIFLLDEPLQHLDLNHQAQVLGLMRLRAQTHSETVVMVMHEPLWIGSACTHAIVFGSAGRVEAGSAEALLTREKLEDAYGCALREVVHAEGRYFVPDV